MGLNPGGRRFRRTRTWCALLAVVGSLTVGVAPAAHALSVCAPGCPVAANEDDYTVTYNPAGTKLHMDSTAGVLANDIGPSTTVVDLQDTPDEPGTHLLTTFNGMVSINNNGSFTYTPDPSFTGVDSFDYYIWDSTNHDNWDFNTVSVTVTPVVTSDAYAIPAGGTLNIGAPGVFANDSGVDPTSLTFDVASANGGSITDNGNGAFSYTAPPNFSGQDTFTYDVWDTDFDLDYTGLVTITVADSIAPVVSMASPVSAVNRATTIPVGWSGSDNTNGSGIDHYDVQVNTGVWNSTFSGWVDWQAGTTATAATYTGSYGRSYCFRARAVDRADNASGWSMSCTSVPLRATSLSYSSGWTTTSNSAYFGGTAKSTKTYHAKATRTGVVAKHIWLVVTKCATCGTVQVRWNNVVKANLNLASSTTTHRQLVAALSLSSASSGTVTLYVTSSSRSVVLEGVDIYLH